MKNQIILITFVIISLCDAVNIQTTTFDGVPTGEITNLSPFMKIGNKYYWIEDNKKVNWFQAANICRTKGAHLASIDSEEESQALSAHFLAKDYTEWFWIGGNDLGKEHDFYWQGTGLAMTFTNWAGSQPDNAFGGEHCVNIWRNDNNFTWNDNTCTNTCYFVCEIHSPKTISLTVW